MQAMAKKEIQHNQTPEVIFNNMKPKAIKNKLRTLSFNAANDR